MKIINKSTKCLFLSCDMFIICIIFLKYSQFGIALNSRQEYFLKSRLKKLFL